jgi:putative membrane protein
MKPLSHLQTLAFTLGGLLLLAGALLPMVPTLSHYAPYVFSAGALLFGTLQLVQRYDGRSITVRRLRRQQMLGALLLMISACLMLVAESRLLPLRGGEWKITLAVAAVLELYTAFRLPAELDKEDNN